MEIILASASPRRRQLLTQVGIPHQVVPSRAAEDETGPADRMVGGNALAKAREVARRVAGGLVIGADTTVVVDGEVLAKPSDPGDAVRMLCSLSGRWHQVLTGVAVLRAPGGQHLVEVESTGVLMRGFSAAEARAYVGTGEPMDKAGAYGIQGRGALLVERIDGCYFNVVGLPLPRLVLMLGKMGYKVPWTRCS